MAEGLGSGIVTAMAWVGHPEGSVPSPETSTCLRHCQKKKKRKKREFPLWHIGNKSNEYPQTMQV